MDAIRRFLAVLGADLRQRSRTPRFCAVMVAVGFASWWCFPGVEADYLTVSLRGGERGSYSSAWIGLVLALVFGMLLSLAGFYLVRGTVARDMETRVWELLVATPMTRAGYLLAKWASHMAVLGLMVGVGLAVGLAAQWVHAEDRNIDVFELLKPVLLLTLPSLAITCAIAVWFDLVPWLRRSAGNALFFVVWLTMTSVTMSQFDPQDNAAAKNDWMSDPNGIALVLRDLDRLHPPQSEKQRYNLSVGRQPLNGKPPTRFDWSHWPLQSRDIAGRLLWLGLALGLLLLATPFLDRFAARSSATANRHQGGRQLRWLNRLLAPLQRLPLGLLISTEIRQVLRRRAWWWWLAACVFAGMQLFAPDKGLAFAVLAAWLLYLDVFSRLALRESEHGTGALVMSAAGIRWRLLAARSVTAIGLAWAASAPALLRLAFSDPGLALVLLTVGASLALWGLALAALLRSSRPFELSVLVLAYIGIQDDGPLNLLGPSAEILFLHGLGLPLAFGILLIAWRALTAADRGRAQRTTVQALPSASVRVSDYAPSKLAEARPR